MQPLCAWHQHPVACAACPCPACQQAHPVAMAHHLQLWADPAGGQGTRQSRQEATVVKTTLCMARPECRCHAFSQLVPVTIGCFFVLRGDCRLSMCVGSLPAEVANGLVELRPGCGGPQVHLRLHNDPCVACEKVRQGVGTRTGQPACSMWIATSLAAPAMPPAHRDRRCRAGTAARLRCWALAALGSCSPPEPSAPRRCPLPGSSHIRA